MNDYSQYEYMLSESVVNAKASVIGNVNGITLFRKNGKIFKIENDSLKTINPRGLPGRIEITETELQGYLDKIIEYTNRQTAKWGIE